MYREEQAITGLDFTDASNERIAQLSASNYQRNTDVTPPDVALSFEHARTLTSANE